MTLHTDLDPAVAAPAPPPGRRAGFARRLLLGGPQDPRWARPALLGVLALATVLYVWNLSAVGNANSYYAAAVLSGTRSWKALFFGSLDAGSFITVDKPPVALWVMGLSARIFGFSSWSMLLPQAASGVAAVGVLYATVRRALTGALGGSGAAAAGTVAGLVMALTPITVAINRDNNPDTVLVLLLVLGAWALSRALEQGRLGWLLLSATFVGFAFNTKMLQAFLVLPAFTLVYLVCANPPMAVLAALRRRAWQLLAAGAALVVTAGWWMVLVDAIPASKRPFIGSSTKNSVWDLVIGYNGLGRVFGQSRGGGGAPTAREAGRQFGIGGSGGGGPNFGGRSGAGRLFNDTIGGQVSWLIPFAAIALVIGLLLLGRRPRTDAARAALLLWGGWLAVHWAVFSFSAGTFHPYYTTTLAPALGALAGAGGVLMFRASRRWLWALPLALAVTGAWSITLLRRTPSWHPWLVWVVAAGCAVGALGFAAVRLAPRARGRLAAVAVAIGLVGALAGPAAYAVTPLSGSGGGMNGTNPLAGPSTGSDVGGPGRMGGFPGGFPGGQPSGALPNGAAAPGGQPPGGLGGPGRMGGEVDSAMLGYLEKNQGGATWLVAVSSAQSAGSIILQTGKAVIAMGGFTGSDPAMSVARLRSLVKSGQLHYVQTGGGRGGGPDGGDSTVTAWVRQNCTAVPASAYGGSTTTTSASDTSSAALYRCG